MCVGCGARGSKECASLTISAEAYRLEQTMSDWARLVSHAVIFCFLSIAVIPAQANTVARIPPSSPAPAFQAVAASDSQHAAPQREAEANVDGRLRNIEAKEAGCDLRQAEGGAGREHRGVLQTRAIAKACVMNCA
jgi:hypothetical protein